MLYNVIGDIHGRTSWKNLVVSDAINIFVGDYFSPYDELSFEQCKQNFMDIIKFKNEHPETILLLGNHDEDHWHWLGNGERMTRHDYLHENDICELFEMYKDLFTVAYSANNKYIITHAGVSALWFYNMYMWFDGVQKQKLPRTFCDLSYSESEQFNTVKEAYEDFEKFRSNVAIIPYEPKLKPEDYTLIFWKGDWYYTNNGKFEKILLYPDLIANTINEFWRINKDVFSWKYNAEYGDYWGNSPTQSPLWIRPEALSKSSVFRNSKEYFQIVGHTQFKGIEFYKNIVFTDCLGYTEKSFTFEC